MELIQEVPHPRDFIVALQDGVRLLRREKVLSPAQAEAERTFASALRLWEFRGARFWVASRPEGLVSINVTRFQGSKAKNGWGRYANWIIAYTLPPYRQQGIATRLEFHVERVAVQEGMRRLKSLAGTWGGVRLHIACGHVFWGLARGGELAVDCPLPGQDGFPAGVPVEVRAAAAGEEPLAPERIVALAPGLRAVPESEVARVLAKLCQNFPPCTISS